jgi:TetR/AcrR family transcriptional regulator of autoinduction and epiphytic fitness
VSRAAPTTPTTPPVDGRARRRERNRDAVVTALLELYREGRLQPSVEEVAARAGISVRSVFRYFDDTEAMVRAGIARQQQHLAPLYALEVPAGAPFPERLRSFVRARTRLLAAMGAVGRVARALAIRQPLVEAELTRIRQRLRDQLTEVFAAEIAALPPAERDAAVAAADVAASWEAYHLMTDDQGLTPEQATEAMARALARLLAPEGA